MYETHTHTPLCKHADGRPEEYASYAHRRGLEGLIVTCHNPMPKEFAPGVRMSIDQFDDYQQMVHSAAQLWEGRVDIRLGIEADYFPGYETWLEQQLQTADFQYVIGSIHPQTREFRERFWKGDCLACQRDYFRLLADSAETGLFDCLGHPDVIKNETVGAWDPDQVMDDVCAALDRIAATGVAMELNTSGLHKSVPQMNPFPQMLVEMCHRHIPVVVGADAHRPQRVGDRFYSALNLLERCGYQQVSYFLERVRHDISIRAARESLQARPDADACCGTDS